MERSGIRDGPDPAPGPPLAAVALVSAAALGYELLLTRLFSMVQWHHFASMIVSLALLGFGVSGTFLALASGVPRRYPRGFVSVNAALFAVAATGCYLLAQEIPLNALALVWDWRQPLWLAAIYLVLMFPFLFAANCIGGAFVAYRGRIPRIYAADLTGAGAGVAATLALLFVLPPERALLVVSGVAAAAAILALPRSRPAAIRIAATVLAGAAPLALPAGWVNVIPSEFKGLSHALRVTGASVVATRFAPTGVVTVVDNRTVPLRSAPGLSLAAPGPPPHQLALFVDGNPAGTIDRFDGDPGKVGYLDYLTSALPYHLARRPRRVLVLGAGGGSGVLQALVLGAAEVHAVEPDPHVVALVRETFRGFSGGLYDTAGVRVHIVDPRVFLARREARFDLVQVSALGSGGAASAGLLGPAESPLFTVESFTAILRILTPGGVAAITGWSRLPPREGPKLLATAIAALRREGVADPARHLAWIRSLRTITLAAKREPLTGEDVAALRRFADARRFDLAYHPGIRPAAANRYNVLPRPRYLEAARALVGDGAAGFVDRYKYRIAPATDDRPYFHDFFRWQALPEILRLRDLGGAALLELGYPLLVLTLLQALVLSVVLVLLPLALAGRGTRPGGARGGRIAVYFLTVGGAFLLMEIAFLHRLVPFLGHPAYGIGTVLAGFLVSAGLGSRFVARRGAEPGPVVLPVAGIAGLAVLYATALPVVLGAFLALPLAARLAIALGLIAPLGFLMGMPFPAGLAKLSAVAPGWIPWAWGLNGCASVTGAALATVLAMHAGTATVILLAAASYVAALAARPETFGAPLPRAGPR